MGNNKDKKDNFLYSQDNSSMLLQDKLFWNVITFVCCEHFVYSCVRSLIDAFTYFADKLWTNMCVFPNKSTKYQ